MSRMSIIYLQDHQWQKILPFLRDHPQVYVGNEEKCRRFVEATLWFMRTGVQYRELPAERGNWNSVYKRFARWSKRGIWADMFEYFSDDPDLENVMFDSSITRAHACAAGAPKKTKKPIQTKP
jgi:transposase